MRIHEIDVLVYNLFKMHKNHQQFKRDVASIYGCIIDYN
jgi:hypothetical protein